MGTCKVKVHVYMILIIQFKLQINKCVQHHTGKLKEEEKTEKRTCGNLQLIDQHVLHLYSERVPRIHLLYNVDELLRHTADRIIPAGAQPSQLITGQKSAIAQGSNPTTTTTKY